MNDGIVMLSTCVTIVSLVVLNLFNAGAVQRERMRTKQSHENFDRLKESFDSLRKSFDEISAANETQHKANMKLVALLKDSQPKEIA